MFAILLGACSTSLLTNPSRHEVRPAAGGHNIFDRHVAALEIASVAQPFAEFRKEVSAGLQCTFVKIPDHWHRWLLLRARRARPRGAAPPSVAKNFRRPMWLAM